MQLGVHETGNLAAETALHILQQIVLLIGAAQFSGDAGIERLHHDRAFAPFDALRRSRHALDDVGRAALRRFDPQIVFAHAARSADVFVDVVAAFGMLRPKDPFGVFKVVAGSRHPRAGSGHDHALERLLGKFGADGQPRFRIRSLTSQTARSDGGGGSQQKMTTRDGSGHKRPSWLKGGGWWAAAGAAANRANGGNESRRAGASRGSNAGRCGMTHSTRFIGT